MIDFKMPFRNLRIRKPLVQCITNFVTVNDCANILLAASCSPTMAHDIREVEESVEKARALVCNMGAIEDVEAMILAGKRANAFGKPVILDPVGVGGTQLRRDSAKALLEAVHFSVIRGNASEIRYLAGAQTTGSGVDAAVVDAVTEENLTQAIAMVSGLARRLGSVVVLSGALDVISDGHQTVVIRNGCATMARITGSGCMLTALIGGFCGANPADIFSADCCAVAAMGICGEMAEAKRLAKGTGNATFRTDLIDAVFNLTEEQLLEGVRYEVF